MYIFIFILGLLFFTVGICSFVSLIHRKCVCTEPTTALVVDIVVRSGRGRSGTRNSYFPVFLYYADQQVVEIEHNVSPAPYQIGEELSLLYNTQNPRQYYIPGYKGGNWVVLFCGIVFSGVGGLVLFMQVKSWLLPLLF